MNTVIIRNHDYDFNDGYDNDNGPGIGCGSSNGWGSL